jgi:YidC/Oxa1 family membrane protein insertase
MELRLLFAFVLMGVVLFLTPYFYKTVAPPVKKTAPAAAASEPASGANSAAPPAAPAATVAAPAAESSSAPRVELAAEEI